MTGLASHVGIVTEGAYSSEAIAMMCLEATAEYIKAIPEVLSVNELNYSLEREGKVWLAKGHWSLKTPNDTVAKRIFNTLTEDSPIKMQITHKHIIHM